MSPAFPARQRADEFNRLAESSSATGDARLTAGSDLERLASLASSLRELPQPAPRAAFSASLRERLMAAAETELTVVEVPAQAAAPLQERLSVRRPSTSLRGRRRLTAGIAALAIVGATAGTALASQKALPGDPLYTVKRAIEGIRSGVSTSDAGKGNDLLQEADTRLGEVRALSQRSNVDTGEVTSTLAAFSSQAQQASSLLVSDYQAHHDAQSLTALQSFTAAGMTQLGQLATTLPASAKSALTSAAQTLIGIDQTVQQLCPACGAGVTQLPSTLLQTATQSVSGLTGLLHPGRTRTTTVRPGGDPAASATGRSQPGQSTGGAPASTSSAGSAPQHSTAPSSDSAPQSKPTKDTLGDTVGGLVGGVGSAVGGLLGGSKSAGSAPTSSAPTSTPPDVVGGLLNGVGGVVGGLLGGSK